MTETTTDTARHYMAGAWKHLAEDDLLQASEKGWGATAQLVKAAAELRGWEHNSHRPLLLAAARLVDEEGDVRMCEQMQIAVLLGTNAGEGWLPRGSVARALTRVEEQLGKLEPLVR